MVGVVGVVVVAGVDASTDVTVASGRAVAAVRSSSERLSVLPEQEVSAPKVSIVTAVATTLTLRDAVSRLEIAGE